MWYNWKHVEIKDPKSWYNTASEEYAKYHKRLNDFDQWIFQKFLPRIKWVNIIDLWAGDWRIFNLLQKLDYKYYIACDIADQLLKRHPSAKNLKKVVCDLEQELPFESNYFDLATTFFVLEHIQDLDILFSETDRILKPGGRWLIGHFLQRHEFVRKVKKEEYKIEFYNHRLEELKKIAEENRFSINIVPVQERGSIIWNILILEKH